MFEFLMQMNQKRFLKVNDPQVVHETIDGETILLDLRTGMYYSMNPSGSALWDFLANTGDPQMAEEILCEKNPEQRLVIHDALASFVAQLLDEGLMVPDVNETREKIADEGKWINGLQSAAMPFESPVMNKYEDMQHLLLLDPIHEVDNTGWPEPQPKD